MNIRVQDCQPGKYMLKKTSKKKCDLAEDRTRDLFGAYNCNTICKRNVIAATPLNQFTEKVAPFKKTVL